MKAARQQAGSTNIGTGNDNMPETHQSFQGGMQRRVLKQEKKKWIRKENGTNKIYSHK